MKLLKEKIKSLYNIGTSRIRFTPEALKLIGEKKYNTDHSTALAKQLFEKKLLRIIPVKKRSYKIYHVSKKRMVSKPKTKFKCKPDNQLSYLIQRKIVTRKKLWMAKVRSLRSNLRKIRSILPKGAYRIERNNIKGNCYKRVKDLLEKYEKQ